MTTKRRAAGSRRTSKNGWLAGGPNGAGDRGQARGPSEPGGHLEAAGDRGVGRGVRPRRIARPVGARGDDRSCLDPCWTDLSHYQPANWPSDRPHSRPSGCLAGRSPGARLGRMPGRAAPGPRQPQRPHDAASPRSPPASWMGPDSILRAGIASRRRRRLQQLTHADHVPSVNRRVGRAVVVRQRPAGAGPHRAGGAAVAVADYEVYRPAAAPTLPRHRAMLPCIRLNSRRTSARHPRSIARSAAS